MLNMIEFTNSGASFKPNPIPIPADSIKDNPKNTKKIAFLD